MDNAAAEGLSFAPDIGAYLAGLLIDSGTPDLNQGDAAILLSDDQLTNADTGF